jgi:hypothetical protein
MTPSRTVIHAGSDPLTRWQAPRLRAPALELTEQPVPGLAIACVVLALTLLGDFLRDALDPTLRRR